MADTDTSKSPPIGAIGENVHRNVEDLRRARKLSLPGLSARLGELGRPILPSVLHRLGQGKRRVDADDLVALAAALGVNPSALLLPRDAGRDVMLELTPALSARAWIAWEWSDGRMPLPAKDPGEGQPAEIPAAEMADFITHARPALAERRSHPAIRETEQLLARLLMALRDMDEDNRDWWAAYVRRALKRVEIEVDELFDSGA